MAVQFPAQLRTKSRPRLAPRDLVFKMAAEDLLRMNDGRHGTLNDALLYLRCSLTHLRALPSEDMAEGLHKTYSEIPILIISINSFHLPISTCRPMLAMSLCQRYKGTFECLNGHTCLEIHTVHWSCKTGKSMGKIDCTSVHVFTGPWM